ncbi:MAG: phosphoglycolate phosphatase [bacterium]|nr:phosphoglycolate phosphatase [bacterium]
MRYRHVAFDLDGTLADTRADIVAAANAMLTELGRPPQPLEVVQGYVGEGARRLVERLLGAPEPAAVAGGLRRFLDFYARHLLDATRLYPGVADALAALAARGIVLTVCTNKPEAMSRTILDGLRVGRLFREVVGGDTLPTRKPDPQGLLLLCERVGIPPGDALLVGDSGIDVHTARAAGVAFCGVAWGLTPEGMWAAEPSLVIDDAAALLGVVEG